MMMPIPFGKDFKFEESIEILGIKLCFDDILIFGVMYLLYKEGVRDYLLFIALFLLTDIGQELFSSLRLPLI